MCMKIIGEILVVCFVKIFVLGRFLWMKNVILVSGFDISVVLKVVLMCISVFDLMCYLCLSGICWIVCGMKGLKYVNDLLLYIVCFFDYLW